MKYWDPSAIVALLATEPDSEKRAGQYIEDGRAVTWWSSRIECASALNRRLRERVLDDAGFKAAFETFESFFETCVQIAPSEEVRQRAIRLLRVHALRAGDALQLAAALAASRDGPASLPIVTSDARLRTAAEREGFTVL